MKQKLLFGLLLLMPFVGLSQQKELPQLGKDSLSEIIKAMTLEEKALLVTGTGMPGFGGPVVGETYKLVPGAAGTTVEIPRLGIPAIVVADGPAGLRISPKRENDPNTYYCTAFPIATLLSSTWDKSLVQNVGKAMGNEVLEYGVDVLLAPALNIHRNPLGGRNFEYYSEDPVLSGKMAAAMVTGVQSNGVGTSIKHFAANNHETNRMQMNVRVSETTLRDIYLKGFEIAVKESNPWTVMSSYNKINGIYTSESPDLLTNILRKDWGYKGLVMTDWFGGREAAAQMKAGNDLLMPGVQQQRDAIVKAVQNGDLKPEDLDKNVQRVLELILKAPRFKGYKYSNKPDLKAHAQVSRQAATEGMVLLKNNKQALPLGTAAKKIAAFGITSYDIVVGGTGSGDVYEAYSVSLIDGLKNAGYVVDESLKAVYAKYLEEERAKRPKPANPFAPAIPIPEMSLKAEAITRKAGEADVALITIGRSSGEFADRKLVDDFLLSATEKELIKSVTDAFRARGKKAIVVLNIGGVIETASWKDQPDAILLAWQPGQEAGNAIADVLSGKVNPSGKLTSTFPMAYNDVPSSKNFPGKEFPAPAGQPENPFMGKPAEVSYEEGIYVGYRYFTTFNVKPSYEFGYGLSYTNFSYDNFKLSAGTFENQLTVSVRVTNRGKVAGKEAVQLYITSPTGKSGKPAIELKHFGKTRMLKQGESQTLTFKISPDDLASFDSARSEDVVDPGEYQVKVGASVSDIRLKGSFSVPKEIVVEELSKSLIPASPVNELKH